MKDKNKPIIEYLLESEEYVRFDPIKHNRFHFNLCRLVKDEIRSHRWLESEKGRKMSWEDAVKEWMNHHYDDFILAVVPKKCIIRFIKKRSKEFIDIIKFLTVP